MTDAPDDAPFDPYAFPPDLINAQRAAVEAYQALHDYQAKLEWSREPHEGWEEEQPAHGGALRGYHSSRPATDGWTAEQSAEYDRLWAELRRTATVVYAHKHWQRCGTDPLAARQALKREPGALPTTRTPAEGLTQDAMAEAV
ncbi:hypothetical protein [Streptomyces sp. NPDC017964]|uniref:hypothetical protein n=1 Tax=Streptomyces sp. NPDC017964 TaxID=3365022 RepID=UPI0037AD9C39